MNMQQPGGVRGVRLPRCCILNKTTFDGVVYETRKDLQQLQARKAYY